MTLMPVIDLTKSDSRIEDAKTAMPTIINYEAGPVGAPAAVA